MTVNQSLPGEANYGNVRNKTDLAPPGLQVRAQPYGGGRTD